MADRLGDLGLLAIRLTVGGALIAHGTQKLFGWFGGGGPAETGQMMESMGFHPGELNARLGGLGEAGGGLLLALGLATGAGGSAASAAMTSAISVHKDSGAGFFNTSGGYELPLTNAVVAAALAVGGPGRYSLDHVTGSVLNRPWMRFIALGGALAGAAVVVQQKRNRLAHQDAEENQDAQPS